MSYVKIKVISEKVNLEQTGHCKQLYTDIYVHQFNKIIYTHESDISFYITYSKSNCLICYVWRIAKYQLLSNLDWFMKCYIATFDRIIFKRKEICDLWTEVYLLILNLHEGTCNLPPPSLSLFRLANPTINCYHSYRVKIRSPYIVVVMFIKAAHVHGREQFENCNWLNLIISTHV